MQFTIQSILCSSTIPRHTPPGGPGCAWLHVLSLPGGLGPYPGNVSLCIHQPFPPTFACASGMSGTWPCAIFHGPDMDASALALCLTAWLLPVPSLLGVAPFLYPTVMLMQFLRPVRTSRLCSISVCGVCRVGVLRCICRESLGASGSRDRASAPRRPCRAFGWSNIACSLSVFAVRCSLSVVTVRCHCSLLSLLCSI